MRKRCAITGLPQAVLRASNCACSTACTSRIPNSAAPTMRRRRSRRSSPSVSRPTACRSGSCSVRSVEFLSDPKVSGPYNMWLRVVAREVATSGTCLTIVGHTSKTGTDQFNDRLSTQRAVTMQTKIEVQAPETKGRLSSVGVGFRENLVGSGTDDLRDALDRRVNQGTQLQGELAVLQKSGPAPSAGARHYRKAFRQPARFPTLSPSHQ